MPTLDWLNRAEALSAVDNVPYRILQPVAEYGAGGARNLLVQGDNLDALKALLPFYRGRVKCVFIDPPYNTKSAFEHYDDNLEHSQWLSMMRPRLALLRELLAEDGSLWITIDDNEAHYLKVMCDEVFGRRNFIANVVWRSSDASNNDTKSFSVDHNHLFVYGKGDVWKPNDLQRTEENNAHYKNPDNDPNGPWFAGNLSSPKPRPNLRFTVKSPTGALIQPPANGWRWKEETLYAMISSGEMVFSVKGDRLIKKTYLAKQKGIAPSTLWDDIDTTGHNRQAKYELKKLFPEIVTAELFATPKPEKLLERIYHIATNPGDLILDSFLGSGTTAAVAHKMNRRWIGIEMGEHAETHCIPRLQKVIDGEQGGISQAVNWQGGGGFRFMRLGEPMFAADGSIHPAVRFDTLANFIWMQETGFAAGGSWDMPKLGVHEGRAIYLLFNGILGDKRPQSGNVLTQEVLAAINDLCPHEGAKVIYGEACRLGEKRLAAEGITFKHIPYDVKAR